MADEYGSRMNGAVHAVAQMHSDTSKLLIDCDRYVGKGRTSLFGNNATKDLTYSVQAECWMAYAVYRFYLTGRCQVDGVTVVFREKSIAEPMFLLSDIQYRRDSAVEDELAATREVCDVWDLWSLYFEWGERTPEVVIKYGSLAGGRIESARLIAVPLYSISSIENVVDLAERLRAPTP